MSNALGRVAKVADIKNTGLIFLILLFLLPGPAWCGDTCLSGAVAALESLRQQAACCIIRRAYGKAFAATRQKLSCLTSRRRAAQDEELVMHIMQALAHYQKALEVYRLAGKGLICGEKPLADLRARYPQARLAFDKGGAMMEAPSGKRCLAPALLVPLIFRQAAKEVVKAKEIWDRYYAVL